MSSSWDKALDERIEGCYIQLGKLSARFPRGYGLPENKVAVRGRRAPESGTKRHLRMYLMGLNFAIIN